jgi:hypothetical protein
MFVEDFGKAILTAQRLYEESFDKKTGKYKKPHEEVALEACEECGIDERYSTIITLLNFSCWNDVQMWAQEVQP